MFVDGSTQSGSDCKSNSFSRVKKNYTLEAPLSGSRISYCSNFVKHTSSEHYALGYSYLLVANLTAMKMVGSGTMLSLPPGLVFAGL